MYFSVRISRRSAVPLSVAETVGTSAIAFSRLSYVTASDVAPVR